MATASVAIVTFWSLAIYVVTRNPRRSISWVFAGFSLAAANHYLTGLFLYPRPGEYALVTPFPLRWKWVSAVFSATFYLHLTSFYFPPAWRRYRSWTLRLAYLISAALASAALFTDLLVAGPLYRPPPHIIGPLPGPLMPFCTAFFALEVIVGVAGLITGYRATLSRSLRRQIRRLLTPTGLIILASVVNWIIVLTKNIDRVPHEWSDALLIVAGCLYARAAFRHGSLAGRPLDRRDLFYSTLAAASGLLALFLATSLDNWLAAYTPFPYPLAMSFLVLAIAVGYAPLGRWATRQLDGLLFPGERRRRETVHHLAEILAETTAPERLQVELLHAVCVELDVRGGYIALPDPDSPSESLTVCAVQGDLSVRPGNVVRLPPLRGREPLLVTGLHPAEHSQPSWRDVALFCPVTMRQGRIGILALGEKRNGKPFTHDELAFCGEVAGQLSVVRRLVRLRKARNDYIEAAHLRGQALQRLEKQVAISTRQAVAVLEHQAAPSGGAPLEIRILGPLQVARAGRPIPEATWGTERAKDLLAYLLWKGQVGATREELCTSLWPDRPVAEAANVFHVTLHRLRQALEPGLGRARDSRYLLHERRRYRFNFYAPHRLDVTSFQALAADGDIAALGEAVALYRGPYLEDAGYALPPEVEIQRRALERLYADALRRLITHTDGPEALPFLERLLAVEPAEEMAHRALVLGYLARGRRDLAGQQVARWREVLDELHLEPAAEARALWRVVEKNATGQRGRDT